jgi:predicted RNA binding protein YcfA (HicA-like mRNA interferase family)
MAKLPVCSGQEAIKAFQKAGWAIGRPQKGSHVSLVKKDSYVILTVPLHKELGPGLLRRLIRDSGMTVEEFVDLLLR